MLETPQGGSEGGSRVDPVEVQPRKAAADSKSCESAHTDILYTSRRPYEATAHDGRKVPMLANART